MTYWMAIVAIVATVFVEQGKKPAPAAALQGTWVITSVNGQPPTPEMSLTFTGDKYHQTVGSDVNERGTIKVDASKKPMLIDLIITEGSDAGKTQLGVIEVSGDGLRGNLSLAGAKERPTDFTAKEGLILFVAKKKKP